MTPPADKPKDTPASPGVATVREALLAEALGDANKLLLRLEAMEQRIQALAEQLDAKSNRFETQTARYTKALGDLQRAAHGLLRRDLQARNDRLQAAEAQAVLPGSSAAGGAQTTGRDPEPANSHRPMGRWSRHPQLQPFWLRHAWPIFFAGLASVVLAGVWIVKF